LIRLLDRTLSTLEYGNGTITGNKLTELVTLISRSGADWIEITPEAYDLMGSVPAGIKAIMRVHHSMEVADFPGFDYYISKSRENCDTPRFINEIQVNDVKEIELLNRYQNLKYVCITGLDDLLLSSYAREMKKLMDFFGRNTWFCPENDYDCATALALEWMAQGGRNVGVTFMGQGGYAAFEEVILGVRIAFRQKGGADLTLLPRILELISEMTPVKIPSNKAVLGSGIFTVESGVHVDGLIKNPTAYEPYPPQWVGKECRIVLGKHSGRCSVRIKASELGVELSDQKAALLLEKVRNRSIEEKRGITDEEFLLLLREVAGHEA